MSARMRSFAASYCFRVSGSDITFDTDVQINLFCEKQFGISPSAHMVGPVRIDEDGKHTEVKVFKVRVCSHWEIYISC